MKKKLLLILFLLTSSSISIYCQDSYFFNAYRASLFLNPSNTAVLNSNEDIRFSYVSHLQWRTTGKSFQSHNIEYNTLLNGDQIGQSKVNIGLGGFLNYNTQGGGSLRNTQGQFTAASSFRLGLPNDSYDKRRWFASLGGGVGFFNRSIDISGLIFNDQIVNNNSPISQDINKIRFENITIFDASIGGTLGYGKEKNDFREYKFLVGASANHLSRGDKISFTQNNSEILGLRWSISGIAEFYFKQSSKKTNFIFKPSAVYSKQDIFQQMDINGLFSWSLGKLNIKPKNIIRVYENSLDFGLGYQGVNTLFLEDHYRIHFLVINLGATLILKNKKSNIKEVPLNIGFSMDFPLASSSNLNLLGQLKGRQEIFIVYKFRKGQNPQDNLPCLDI